MLLELVRKGESRCYVFKEEHISIVGQIIKELDDFEYDYMPNDWICVWDENWKCSPPLVYNGKFDINVIQLIQKCAEKKVAIIIKSTNIDDVYLL